MLKHILRNRLAIYAKFYVEPLWIGGLKVCSWHLCHMSKMAATLIYEGDSICNEIVPINQKVLYLYTLQLHSQKGLLLGYTTANSQLSSSFTTLHNPLSRKDTKLHCDTNLSSGFKVRILYELSLFSVCLFVW